MSPLLPHHNIHCTPQGGEFTPLQPDEVEWLDEGRGSGYGNRFKRLGDGFGLPITIHLYYGCGCGYGGGDGAGPLIPRAHRRAL